MAAKKKEAKPISAIAAAVMIVIAFLAMGVFLVYMFSSGDGGVESSVDTSLEQSFGAESSIAPPVSEIEVKETMADAEVGDGVIFGSYEQNGNTADGSEPLEWIVLEKQSDKLLLISRYCVDTLPYNTERADTEWAESSLHTFLNSDFCNQAFTAEELSEIIGESKVTMLSAEEAVKYYEYDSWRMAEATKYAVSKGARIENGSCWWWLTDKGSIENSASYIHFDGTIRSAGFSVDYGAVAVRPVIWVSSEAETETEEISEPASEEASE